MSDADKIIEHLESWYVAVCDRSTGGVFHTERIDGVSSEIEAADYFYESGWRVIRRKLCCPGCVSRAEGKA